MNLFKKKNKTEKANFLPTFICEECDQCFRAEPKFSSDGTKIISICPKCGRLNVKKNY